MNIDELRAEIAELLDAMSDDNLRQVEKIINAGVIRHQHTDGEGHDDE